MKIISKIEIQYFRSIYRSNIIDLADLNIFTGKNDVGKSNVLKALNLFFNNNINDGGGFDFQENFNKIRFDQVRKESVKGKQFIQIKVTFNRGNSMEKTLPEQFTVTKKWLRYDTMPLITDDLEKRCEKAGLKYNDRTKSSLTKFLNSIYYIYVPAIKDSRIFNRILNMLQETLYNDKLTGDKGLIESLAELAKKVQSSAEELNSEFFEATNVSSNISSPKSITEFYSTLSINTVFAENYSIKLDNRGDGIRVRYLPSILNYLAVNSKKNIIWGFEEPENSVEYNLAIKMADSFKCEYCKTSMIFLTSHSPAFVNLVGDKIQLYRCFNEDGKTNIYTSQNALGREELAMELGYLKIQEDVFKEYTAKKDLLDRSLHETSQLKEKIDAIEKPVIITEGKTDAAILKSAWDKLHSSQCRPFEICSCDIIGDGQSAGCDMLKNYLTSYRFDSPHIVIGLFDRDTQGIKSFELSKNFVLDVSGLFKKSKNNKAFALLLPAIESKKEFIKFKNFCIEFMFDEPYLSMQVEGKGLELKDGITVEQFNGVTISCKPSDDLWFKTIEPSSKNYFSEKVVPTLPPEAFENFKHIFAIIEKIIKTKEK